MRLRLSATRPFARGHPSPPRDCSSSSYAQWPRELRREDLWELLNSVNWPPPQSPAEGRLRPYGQSPGGGHCAYQLHWVVAAWGLGPLQPYLSSRSARHSSAGYLG